MGFPYRITDTLHDAARISSLSVIQIQNQEHRGAIMKCESFSPLVEVPPSKNKELPEPKNIRTYCWVFIFSFIFNVKLAKQALHYGAMDQHLSLAHKGKFPRYLASLAQLVDSESPRMPAKKGHQINSNTLGIQQPMQWQYQEQIYVVRSADCANELAKFMSFYQLLCIYIQFDMHPNSYLIHPCYLPQVYPYCWILMDENVRHQEVEVSQVFELKMEEPHLEKQTLSENSKSEKLIHKQKNVKEVRTLVDDQWSPQKKNRKKKNSHNQEQKMGRNAVSNIMRSYLKYLTTHEAMEELQRLKQNFTTSINMAHILQMMEKANVSHRNYVRMKSVSTMLSQDMRRKGEASKIFVMIFRKYARTGLKIHFLTSSKLKEDNRSDVLMKIREVEAGFANALRQQQSGIPI